MGEVYRATDTRLERTVAVKLLAERYAADREVRQRFRREALAAARLSPGPNTVTVYDVGEWQGRPYIVMEHLAGGSVEQWLQREGPPAGQALVWLGQAAVALDHAHAHGIVHRDVKPANLLEVGARGRIVAVDISAEMNAIAARRSRQPGWRIESRSSRATQPLFRVRMQASTRPSRRR